MEGSSSALLILSLALYARSLSIQPGIWRHLCGEEDSKDCFQPIALENVGKQPSAELGTATALALTLASLQIPVLAQTQTESQLSF